MAEALIYAGVDVANLANNHTMDYGVEGLRATQSILDKSGIEATGVGELTQIKVGETNFGFLGFNFVSNGPSEEDYQLIRESNTMVDVLIVGVHWGLEYVSEASYIQRETAKLLVEAGADVVAGHHPHVVQEREEIGGKPVFYSLGNLVFDQGFEVTRPGLAIRLTFEHGELVSTQELPTYMSSWVQPEFVEK
jgi:poly-gamma-glutamate synthesis protein (capsule biosynthesis protein)